MSKYYVVLTGALKNAGDYLITEKCKELLRYERPDYELVQLNREDSLENDLELINNSEALILMGGPAVTKNLYPGVYKLTRNLDDIKVPIVPMAVGWNTTGGSFDDMLNFAFTDESKKLLERFDSNGVGVSTRDSYTADILTKYGMKDIHLTGCASWYTPSKFGEELATGEVQSIAYTPAQDPKYANLSKRIIDLIVEEYPNKRLICSFHRGIGEVDQYTYEEEAQNTQDLADYAISKGMETIDLAYSFDNYSKYDEIDMHIGFRVHGHLYFLSNRKPSILLHEDGRGKAMSETIGLKGVDVFKPSKVQKGTDFTNKVFRKLGFPFRYHPEVRNESYEELSHLIRTHKANNNLLMNGVLKNFDKNYKVMKEFILNLP